MPMNPRKPGASTAALTLYTTSGTSVAASEMRYTAMLRRPLFQLESMAYALAVAKATKSRNATSARRESANRKASMATDATMPHGLMRRPDAPSATAGTATMASAMKNDADV